MKEFIIYGAATFGSVVRNILETLGLDVVGYIDKRAYELKICNQLPVWSIDDVPSQLITSETTVFVGVKNVFEHEKIVRILVDKGFSRIIYKPYNVLLGNGNEDEVLISEIYDMFFRRTPEVIHAEVPTKHIDASMLLHDYAVIKDIDYICTAYIPAEFIFTNESQKENKSIWEGINILSFFTHIDLFCYLDGKEGTSPESYLKDYCEQAAKLQNKVALTDAWRENVIRNRTQIYERMSDNLNLDFDFFVRNAPEAIWNEKDHVFNLVGSGKHRCTFLAAKGMKYIPLKIKKRDYQEFYHKEKVKEVANLLCGRNEDILIPHPCFYRDDRNSDNGAYEFLLWFARYYGRLMYNKSGNVSFRCIYVLDSSNDSGHFARFAYRLGCIVKRVGNISLLEKALDQLFYTNYSNNGQENFELKGNVHKIAVVDVKNLETMLPVLDEYKEVIVRYCSQNVIVNFCQTHNMTIVQKVCERFIGLEGKGTYLLRH